jgi:hypothetical protein
MLVCGMGIRDIGTVIKVHKSGKYGIKPKQTAIIALGQTNSGHIQAKRRIRLIYDCHRDTEETAAFVRGKHDLKPALKLKKRIRRPGITCCLDRN